MTGRKGTNEMKRMLILLGASAILAVTLMAQIYPMPSPYPVPIPLPQPMPLPAPAPIPAPMPQPMPHPLMCHDEPICTPMGGCRWVTVCN
jgi:hypothetical protein